MIQVYDNFLERDLFEKINNKMMNDYFPWRYRDGIVTYDDPGEYFQFVHTFFNSSREESDEYKLIFPLLEKLEVKALVRAKANLLTRTEEHIEHGFHVDYPFDCYSAVYYINTNNGYTLFSDGTKVNSLENRMVVFNSQIKHTGATCTDQKTRVVLNLNFF